MATINGENLAPGPGLGLATILRPDYTPLRIMQQSDAVRARRAAADAALRQKQALDIAKQRQQDLELKLDTGGYFQEPYNKATANASNEIGQYYADEAAGKITTAERQIGIANLKNGYLREGLLGTDLDKALVDYQSNPKDKDYRDADGIHTAIGLSLMDEAGQRKRATQYDRLEAIKGFDNDPRTYAADPIIGDYYKGLQASTIDEANAGRIGGIHSSSSLTYKGLLPVKRADGTWDVKRDALGRPVIGTTAQELDLARQSNHSLNMAVGRLRHDYDNMRTENPSLPQKSDLDLFQQASQKYVSFRQADSKGRNAQLAVGRSSAGKLKASDAVATPTSSFNLSTYQDPGNPAILRNNYGGVGHTLASEKQPFVPVTVNSKDLTILGDDKKASHANKQSVNSQIKMSATNRQLILTVKGKRYGLSEVPDGTDAHQDMVKAIDKMTPAEAREAVGKIVYHGGITDKSRTSGDGGGGKAKIIGYKDSDGEILNERDALNAKNRGDFIQPIYDSEEVQSAVMVPATQEIDAQVARQTLGFNPRQFSEQQADIVRRLEAKGGRIQTPYYTSKAHTAAQQETQQLRQQAGKPAASPGGSIYKRPTTTNTTTTSASRGGSIYKTR